MGVSMNPGGSCSRGSRAGRAQASRRARARGAPTCSSCTQRCGGPVSAATELTFTIEPPGASRAPTAWIPSSAPVTLTPRTRFQSVERHVSEPRPVRDPRVVDETVDSGRGPRSPRRRPRASFPRSATSRRPVHDVARPAGYGRGLADDVGCDHVRPSRTSHAASAAPCPPAAPVTTTTFPSTRPHLSRTSLSQVGTARSRLLAQLHRL